MSELFKSNQLTSERLPILFIGHGSPMNAIANNSFTKMLNRLAAKFNKPKAILVVSAHWMTQGTWVLGMEQPKTIHDFYGFPQELFDVDYPAPGSLQLAQQINQIIKDPGIQIDTHEWGLDHGTWSVLKHLYPNADTPVLQLSLDMSRSGEYHFDLGQQLSKLRDQGVLIVASGNLVHNLKLLNWNMQAQPFEWAVEYDLWLKSKLESRDFKALTNNFISTHAAKLSVPTLDHFLPLHYILGAVDKNDELKFEFEEIHHGSISMRTFGFWPKG